MKNFYYYKAMLAHFFTLILSMLICSSSNAADTTQDEALRGQVEESEVTPSRANTFNSSQPLANPVLGQKNKRKKIKGHVEDTDRDNNVDATTLEGSATEYDTNLRSLQAKPDDESTLLKGSAQIQSSSLSDDDPDLEDKELMIEWDRWRNRFLTAVQSRVQETLNNPDDSMLRWDPGRQAVIARFPLGTITWFSCQITNDRHIANSKLIHSSGFPNYDRAVLDAVKDLDGSAILNYPHRSRRKVVTQIAGIKTAETSERPDFKFGDIERYSVPINSE